MAVVLGQKVSPDNEPHNVTCVVQDLNSTNNDTWYYGTGEALANSADVTGA